MARPSLEKLATGSAVVLATACPICFPKFALISEAFGLSAVGPLEGKFALGVQALAGLGLVANVVAFRRHRNRALLAFAAIATATLLVAFYIVPSTIPSQLSLVALVAASAWLVWENRKCAQCTASLDPTRRSVERTPS